ncbi:MAG: hypothetical protein ACLQBX_17235 [Candidatus Limnocylindrales bacterium]
MSQQPPSEEPEPLHGLVDTDAPPDPEGPGWAWRSVQPVVPVLAHSQGVRRHLSVVLAAGTLFIVVAVVSALVLSLPSSPLTASAAGAGSSPSPSTAAAATRQGTGQQRCQDFLSALAARLNISVDTLETALSGAASDTIGQLVQQGRLTADQATKLKTALSANASSPCTVGGRMGLGMGGFFGGALPFARGFGQGAPGATPFARGFGPGALGGAINGSAILDAAAAALKTNPATLQQQLAALTSGQDLRTIAAKDGVAYATLIAAIHAAVKAQLDTAVTKGTLTSARETALLAGVDKALAAGKLPFAAFGRPFGMMGLGHAWGGAGPNHPTSTPTPAAPGA